MSKPASLSKSKIDKQVSTTSPISQFSIISRFEFLVYLHNKSRHQLEESGNGKRRCFSGEHNQKDSEDEVSIWRIKQLTPRYPQVYILKTVYNPKFIPL